jgi:hypothetical protein
MLYVSFEKNECTLKHNWPTWEVAYCFHQTRIQVNEAKFTYNVNATWDDMEK